MLLSSKKGYIFKNKYLFLCLKVILGTFTLGGFCLEKRSDFGKVQFCPELYNFSQFYPILQFYNTNPAEGQKEMVFQGLSIGGSIQI